MKRYQRISFIIIGLCMLAGGMVAWFDHHRLLPETWEKEIRVPAAFTSHYSGNPAVRWLPYLPMPSPFVVRHGNPKLKTIALTFDDGPDEEIFPKLLALLRERQVKATFFLVGKQIELHKALVIQADREGHQIGNHTYSHERISGLSANQIIEELETVRTQIYQLTGKLVQISRPPGGRLDKNSLEILKALKYSVVLWTHNGGDWKDPDNKKNTAKQNPDEMTIFKRIKFAKGGAIILLHGTNPRTIEVLPQIIDHFIQLGYEFVTVDDLIAN